MGHKMPEKNLNWVTFSGCLLSPGSRKIMISFHSFNSRNKFFNTPLMYFIVDYELSLITNYNKFNLILSKLGVQSICLVRFLWYILKGSSLKSSLGQH